MNATFFIKKLIYNQKQYRKLTITTLTKKTKQKIHIGITTIEIVALPLQAKFRRKLLRENGWTQRNGGDLP